MDPTKRAFLFAGQGAQRVAMGKELYQSFPPAQKIFELAQRMAPFDLLKVIMEGPQDALNRTDISQPAILTVSYAVYLALREETDILADFCAGLSLGEYTALVCAEVLDFEPALELVLKRGKFMQEACDKTPGSMASVLGLEKDKIEEIVEEGRQKGILAVANYNSPNQIVLSGEKAPLEWAGNQCEKAGARRVIPLQVAGAYHSPLMDLAREKLTPFLQSASFATPKIKVVANVTGQLVEKAEEIRENLIQQVTHPVRWSESMELLVAQGVEQGFELGPGTVLKGLMRQINRGVKVYSISDLSQVSLWKAE